jgi:hypothetical protein
MARDDLHFRLRIPEDLKARIEKIAAENGRSMTAEIVVRLERSFKLEETLEDLQASTEVAHERIDDLQAQINSLARELERRF